MSSSLGNTAEDEAIHNRHVVGSRLVRSCTYGVASVLNNGSLKGED